MTENTVIDALFNAGAHIGFGRARRHASVRSQLFGAKNGVDIIDLTKTVKQLDAACTAARELGKQGKTVLFVGAKKEIADLVVEAATAVNMPYVASRWLGGTLTNFVEIKKRIARLKSLTEQFAKGDLVTKYTKKERLMLERELNRLKADFGGIASLEQIPAALIVVDSRAEIIAVTEAIKVRVPVIALCNTDNDLTKVTYPVLANDGARDNVKYFLDTVSSAFKAGTAQATK
jgi:small subunit ribosomal protein S2